jgi:hypothetical protein
MENMEISFLLGCHPGGRFSLEEFFTEKVSIICLRFESRLWAVAEENSGSRINPVLTNVDKKELIYKVLPKVGGIVSIRNR